MGTAELLKQLFLSFLRHDEPAFAAAAQGIIAEVRSQQHEELARELEQILRTGWPSGRPAEPAQFPPPPRDSASKTPLLDIDAPKRSLQELVVKEDIRSALDRLIVEFRGWEALERDGLTPLHRVLFCGPSGCGKTMAAQALANGLRTPLVSVRFDAVVSSSLARTVANLRKVFDYIARGPWVVLFDEFDSLGRSRDDPTERGEHKRVVNAFLQLMDGLQGKALLIAATNFEEALDPALWRRFDEVVRFDRPTVDQLRTFIRRQLAPLLFGEEQVMAIAHGVASGTFADAERVSLAIRRACALREETRVTTEDIKQALRRYAYRRAMLHRTAGGGLPAVDKA